MVHTTKGSIRAASSSFNVPSSAPATACKSIVAMAPQLTCCSRNRRRLQPRARLRASPACMRATRGIQHATWTHTSGRRPLMYEPKRQATRSEQHAASKAKLDRKDVWDMREELCSATACQHTICRQRATLLWVRVARTRAIESANELPMTPRYGAATAAACTRYVSIHTRPMRTPARKHAAAAMHTRTRARKKTLTQADMAWSSRRGRTGA